VAVEIASESPSRRPGSPVSATASALATVDSAALRLLACSASAAFAIALLVLPNGPSESDETLSWVLAFAVALPAGLLLAGLQARRLGSAAPAAAAGGVAAGAVLLAAALFLRREGTGDQFHHALIALAALGALVFPFLVAHLWRDSSARQIHAARAVACFAAAFAALLFVPGSALRPAALLPALALAGLAIAALRLARDRRPADWIRDLVDIGLAALIALIVIQLPEIAAHAPDLIENHTYFLGPANDLLHGRTMLVETWSQYGVGLIDALALAFTVIPIGFGSLTLLIAAATAVLYICVYATLRLAGVGQVLTLLTVAVAAAGNLFAPLDVYVSWPNDSPLRFGLPYLIVLLAVLGAGYPARARLMRIGVLAVLAVGATWSFEALVYCTGTYGALVLVEAMGARSGVVGRVVRGALLGLAAIVAGLALYSLLTLLLAGSLNWGPYLEYLRLYSLEGFSQLPVVFFSAGPLMAAAIFASAVILLWLVRERPAALPSSLRAALAGFTGLAIVTFTYYLGRSHPNNLLILLVPVVALGGLWTHVLLRAPGTRWRSMAAATVVLAGAMVAVAAWPSIEQKWNDTALGLMAPGQGSLSGSLDSLAENPVLDGRVPGGVELLANHLPPHAPALVLTDPELTTEVLVAAERPNLLPISNPNEDTLIPSSWDRVRATVARVPAGTLMLTSPTAPGQPTGFDDLQRAAMVALRRRFSFQVVEWVPGGLVLVRLVPRERSG